jgi:membrane protein
MRRYAGPIIERLIERLPKWAKGPAEIGAKAAKEYGLDRAPRMAAAIAYRTVFALAPMLIIAVSVAGLFLGSSLEAQEELLEGINSIAGPEVAAAMATFLASAVTSANTAAIIGFALLLWSASSLFIELQHDLNDIFDVPYEKISGLVGLVRKRGIGFLWVFGLGLIMILLLVVNGIWGFFDSLLPSNMENLDSVFRVLAPLVSLAILPFVFGLIFQTMTAVTVPWKAVWVGGSFTAVVFVLATYGIGVWFRLFGPTTALGFAGSLVIVLFLAYMLSSVFLFGAEVTRVYANRTASARVKATPMSVDPLVVVSQPPRALPGAALVAFLTGLLIGRRRRRP